MNRRSLFLVLAAALASCSAQPRPAGSIIAPSASDWRAVATNEDRERLRGWRDDFIDALAEARAAGHAATITSEGALLDPDAALGLVPLPNGDFKCRVIKMGARSPGMLPFIAYPAFNCRVAQAGAVQAFAKLTGSQRPLGLIFRDSATRRVFLGTLVLGDETRAMEYGRDPDRDLAAWVEQVGPQRWRMLFPSPRFESKIDVIELVRAP